MSDIQINLILNKLSPGEGCFGQVAGFSGWNVFVWQ
jgi:hypothetical protein